MTKFLCTMEPHARTPAELEEIRSAAREFLVDSDTERRQRALEKLRARKLRDENPDGTVWR